MRNNVTAAIIGAISAYLQEEEMAKTSAATTIIPRRDMTPWRLFGHQELLRSRVNWRTRIVRR